MPAISLTVQGYVAPDGSALFSGLLLFVPITFFSRHIVLKFFGVKKKYEYEVHVSRNIIHVSFKLNTITATFPLPSVVIMPKKR